MRLNVISVGRKGHIARFCRGGKKAVCERPKKLHVIDAGVTDHIDDSTVTALPQYIA